MAALDRSWLDPLREQLDRMTVPVSFFFRADDVGRQDESMLALLHRFQRLAHPLDLAVIPAKLTSAVARTIAALASRGDAPLGVHQHGLVHRNHETGPVKSEFGPARPGATQLADLVEGRDRLSELLDDLPQPIFTPPWNHCLHTTGECLLELGFRALSRDVYCEPLGLPALVELPVSVDWCYPVPGGARLAPAELARMIAARIEADVPIGIVLHHDRIDDRDRDALGQLLELISAHDAAVGLPMLAVVDRMSGAPL